MSANLSEEEQREAVLELPALMSTMSNPLQVPSIFGGQSVRRVSAPRFHVERPLCGKDNVRFWHQVVHDLRPVYGHLKAHLWQAQIRHLSLGESNCIKFFYDINSACGQFATPPRCMNARCLLTTLIAQN